MRSNLRPIRALAAAATALLLSHTAWAGGAAFPVLDIDYDVEDLEFSGTGVMPIGPNFDPVTTEIRFQATSGFGNTQANGPNPTIQDGDQLFFENAAMSVVFDVTLTDVDAVADFSGGSSTITLTDVAVDFSDVVFVPNCIATAGPDFFGCGMLLADNFSEGDVADVGPTNEGGDYDSINVSVPIPLGIDADGQGGIDAITDLILELAFSGPVDGNLFGGVLTQIYEVDALLSGSINPDFGNPSPIQLSGSGTFSTIVPEPGLAALLAGAFGVLLARRRTRA